MVCGNRGVDVKSDQAYRLIIDRPGNLIVTVTGIDGYAFIVDELDAQGRVCSLDAEVQACGPTALRSNLDAGTYYLIVEKVGGGAGNFGLTVELQ